MAERQLMNAISVALSRVFRELRIFRQNVGQGWVGNITRYPGSDDVLIKHARPLRAGLCEGSGDLIGWATVEVTSAMVGQVLAVFTSAEVKTQAGRESPEQLNWRQRVREAGGIALVVRSEADAIEQLQGALSLIRGDQPDSTRRNAVETPAAGAQDSRVPHSSDGNARGRAASSVESPPV